MKFGISIPDKWLPKAMQSDSKAINTVLKQGSKRISINLTRRRQYIASMKQDELKLAIEMAKQVDRPRRDFLYAIYDAIIDGHFTGEYEKAINKVVGSAFAVYKKGSEEIDEAATRLLQKNWFEEYRTYLEESDVFFGHGIVQFLEMVPSMEGSGVKFEFSKIDLIDREHVRPEEGWIVLDVSDEKGIPFRDPTLAKALMIIEMGKPKSLGKMLIIAREYIWKNYSRSDWSRHSEKFGMPMLAIKSASSDEKELDKLEQMAREFGNNLWMIIDAEDEIELKEPTFKDSFNIYKEKVLMCNSEMSKAITWQTGTSDEKSFVGAAKVHENILDDYTEWRKRKQTYHINDVLFPFLIEHGYPLKDLEFKYITYKEEDPDEEDQAHSNSDEGNGGAPGKKTKPVKERALYKYKV